MADRPIEFSAPMITALLDGRKKQTRRVLRQAPHAAGMMFDGLDVGRHRCHFSAQGGGVTSTVKIPYEVGDRLWVKEAHADEHPLAIQDGRYSQPGQAGIPGPPRVRYQTIYRIDGEPLQIWRCSGGHPYFKRGQPDDPRDLKFPTVCSNWTRPIGSKRPVGIHWAQARFMPRRASRLTLIVTDVRVERLQDISETDAVAEGVESDPETNAFWGVEGAGLDGATRLYATAALAFRDLWDGLNDARGFGWAANPWVCAVTFTVHHRNIDSMEAAGA